MQRTSADMMLGRPIRNHPLHVFPESHSSNLVLPQGYKFGYKGTGRLSCRFINIL